MPRTIKTAEEALTPKLYETFAYIYETARDQGRQPSIPEMQVRFKLTSHHGVDQRLDELARKGWIRHKGKNGKTVTRGIRLLRRLDGSKFAGFAER